MSNFFNNSSWQAVFLKKRFYELSLRFLSICKSVWIIETSSSSSLIFDERIQLRFGKKHKGLLLDSFLQFASRILDVKDHFYNCFKYWHLIICWWATNSKTLGNFARILINLHMSQELRDHILVEHEEYIFSVFIDYENITIVWWIM